jgi:serine/tyrosine/threonine adenylyltransferase
MNQLIDFCIDNYYPDAKERENKIIEFFKYVCQSSCIMVVEWMRVGFVHGVMNTDNLSIIGDTIDYGPYGWIDNYDPNWTPNTTDLPGRRYRFSHQPYIVQWNLVKLANTLAPLLPDNIDELKSVLEDFESMYKTKYLEMMVLKLGFTSIEKNDNLLIDDLLSILEEDEIDMTIFFRNLSDLKNNQDISNIILPACYTGQVSSQMTEWCQNYLNRIHLTDHEIRKSTMDSVNPRYVLRNYIAQLAIDAAHKGDYSVLNEVYDMIQNPYTNNQSYEKWYALRPDWAKQKVGCSMLSCSS